MLIASRGSTRCCIMMSHPAHETVKLAADELQKWIYKATGASMPVLTEMTPWEGPRILVGDSKPLQAMGVSLADYNLGEEGYILSCRGDTLIVAGATPRGTLYGAYAFLEEHVGLRWFSSDVTHIPSVPVLEIAEFEDVQKPAFESREAYWRDAFDGDFAVRNRMNSNKADISVRQGGRMKFYNFHHSFDELLPPQDYFAEHPEYYSLVDGKRLGERTQLCLTNPDVLRLVIEKVEEWIAENPDCRVFSVAQNDWYNYCTCPSCAAIDEAEGSPAGTMITFVNKVAEAIEKKHPNVLIHTFSYQYTRPAPKTVRPRHNVIVRLCSIECCFSHPLDGSCQVELNSAANESSRAQCALREEPKFLKDLKDWAKITDRLYVWDYTTNFRNYLMPIPLLNALVGNLRLFRRIGVAGVLEQGNFSHGGGGNLAELYAYLEAKLMWNPDCDMEYHLNDFLEGYYGKGAKAIRKYIDLWQEAVKPWHMTIYERSDAPFVTDELLAESDRLLCEALWAEQDPATVKRIERLQMGITYLILTRLPMETPGRDILIDRFGWQCRQQGITELHERVGLEQGLEFMKRSRYVTNTEGRLRVDYKM